MNALEFEQKLNISVSNFYQLVGDDGFLKSLVVDSLKKLIAPENIDFCFETFEDVCDVGQVVQALNTASFVGDVKIVVVKDCVQQLNANDKKMLTEYVDSPNEQSVLVLEGCGNSFDCIKDFCVKVECNGVTMSDMLAYIKNICLKKGFTIGNNECRTIATACGTDLGKVSQELEKLFLYCADTHSIDEDSISLLMTVDSEIKIFELTNALQKGNTQKVLEIYKTLIARGEKPILLFSVIVKAYRTYFEIAISGAGDDALCKTLGISYSALGVNKKIVDTAKKTQRGYIIKLKNTIDYLYNLEYNFKSGEITPDNALELAISWLIAQQGATDAK